MNGSQRTWNVGPDARVEFGPADDSTEPGCRVCGGPRCLFHEMTVTVWER